MRPDGRFAPSPTGDLHLGNLRTALLAWLFARSQRARFLMRMEDLDAGRVRAGAEKRQLADLAAIGLDWDGPVMRQSERAGAHAEALSALEARDLVYPCFCTRAEIREAASAPHGPLPDGAYPGTCRELTRSQRAQRAAAGRPPALRLRAGAARVAFTDRLHGEQAGVVDDFVLRRNDGAFAYNLVAVVDDAAQGVGEVVRGDDLLDSTPRQVLLRRLLDLPAPRHAHVPLVLGADGARLAKRHGAVTLRGLTAEEALAWICSSLELPTAPPAELVGGFDPYAIPPEPATFVPG